MCLKQCSQMFGCCYTKKVYMLIHTHTCTCTRTHTQTDRQTDTHTHTHTHTDRQTHTHTHTHRQSKFGLIWIIYLTENIESITISYSCFLCEYVLNCNLFLWSKLYFQHHYSSLQCHMIFRNHNNMLICCSTNISEWMNEWRYLYSALLCIFVHSKRFTVMRGVSPQPPPVCSIHLDNNFWLISMLKTLVLHNIFCGNRHTFYFSWFTDD